MNSTATGMTTYGNQDSTKFLLLDGHELANEQISPVWWGTKYRVRDILRDAQWRRADEDGLDDLYEDLPKVSAKSAFYNSTNIYWRTVNGEDIASVISGSS